MILEPHNYREKSDRQAFLTIVMSVKATSLLS